MNLILTDIRSLLLIKHVSALMFIKLHGPPLADWKPGRYVNTWLLRHRKAPDTRTRIRALSRSRRAAAAEKTMASPPPDLTVRRAAAAAIFARQSARRGVCGDRSNVFGKLEVVAL